MVAIAATVLQGSVLYFGYFRRPGHLAARKALIPTIVLTACACISPVDVRLHSGDRFGLAYLPVLYEWGSLERLRNAAQEGKAPGNDFVVFERPPFLFNPPTNVVAITVPYKTEAYRRLLTRMERYRDDARIVDEIRDGQARDDVGSDVDFTP